MRRNICAPQRRRRDGGGGGGGGGGGRRRRQIYRRFEYQTVAVRWTRREHENRRRADRHSRPWIFIPPASLVVWRFWHRKKKIIKKTNTERQQGKRNVEEKNSAEMWSIIFIWFFKICGSYQKDERNSTLEKKWKFAQKNLVTAPVCQWKWDIAKLLTRLSIHCL